MPGFECQYHKHSRSYLHHHPTIAITATTTTVITIITTHHRSSTTHFQLENKGLQSPPLPGASLHSLPVILPHHLSYTVQLCSLMNGVEGRLLLRPSLNKMTPPVSPTPQNPGPLQPNPALPPVARSNPLFVSTQHITL